MPDQEPKIDPTPTPERYYTNAIYAHSGPYDLTLDFGQRVGDADPQYEVRIAMSWEHAVSLNLVLGQLIENYQQQVGPLPDIAKVLRPSLGDVASGEEQK